MGVDVDHAGRQHQAGCVHRLARRPETVADGGDAAVLHREVGLAQGVAEPIGDIGIPDDQIEHAILPDGPALGALVPAFSARKPSDYIVLPG